MFSVTKCATTRSKGPGVRPVYLCGSLGVVSRVLIRHQGDEALEYLDRLVGLYGRENVFIQIERSYLPWEISVNSQLLELAEHMHVLPVAGGPITHHRPEHFPAQDM